MTDVPQDPKVGRYRIHTTIERIWQDSFGWWIHMTGSRESLFLGTETPMFTIGDELEIIVQKRNQGDAKKDDQVS